MNGESQSPSPAPGQQPLMGSSEDKSFWSKNSGMIIRLVVVAVIIVGAVIYARTQNRTEAPVISQSSNGEQAESETGPKITVTDRQGEGSAASQDIVIGGGEVVVSVEKGNGYTHLARRALAEYLKTDDTAQLKPEQKIYIEDYLQKNIPNKKKLHAGDKVTFSENEIQEAISAANDLTAQQIENLHQYTVRVANL